MYKRFSYNELHHAPLIKDAIYECGNKGNPFSDDPLPQLFKIDGFKRGIGNQSGFRKSNKERNGKITNETAFVIIKDSKVQDEWPNEYFRDTSTFKYFGDNRTPGNNYLHTKQGGNDFLEKVFLSGYSNKEIRKKTTPIFVFQSVESGTTVRFLGLAVPGIRDTRKEQALQLKEFLKNGKIYENLIANFTILNCKEISREWLKDLKEEGNTILDNAPIEWINFIEQGINGTELPGKVYTEIWNTVAKVVEHEATYEVKKRKSQYILREKLLSQEKKCKICGLDKEELLIASHIKPWKDSENDEKISFYNALLLCPNHDALFDKGYISFEENGKILISEFIDKKDYKLLSIDENMKIQISEGYKKFLEYHRENVFKK